MAAAGHPGHPRPGAAGRAARHDPAVPDLLRDLRRGAQVAAHPGHGRRRRGRTMTAPGRSGPPLTGQTVVVIGGSSGIGLETARLARAEGADVVLTGRDPGRLSDAAHEVGAGLTAAFDATDLDALDQFFANLPGP